MKTRAGGGKADKAYYYVHKRTLIVRERLFFCRKIQTYGRNSNLNLFFFGNTKEGFLVESLAEEVHHVKEDKARVLIHDKLKVGIDR